MSKIVVSKRVGALVDEAISITNNKMKGIFFISNTVGYNNEERVEAIKAYLNEDGYEVEKSAEEKAFDKFDSMAEIKKDNTICETNYEIGFLEGMIWMDENFKLGLNLKDR